jgi:hypothetical protein
MTVNMHRASENRTVIIGLHRDFEVVLAVFDWFSLMDCCLKSPLERGPASARGVKGEISVREASTACIMQKYQGVDRLTRREGRTSRRTMVSALFHPR